MSLVDELAFELAVSRTANQWIERSHIELYLKAKAEIYEKAKLDKAEPSLGSDSINLDDMHRDVERQFTRQICEKMVEPASSGKIINRLPRLDFPELEPLPKLPEKRAEFGQVSRYVTERAVVMQGDVNQLIDCLQAVYKRMGEV